MLLRLLAVPLRRARIYGSYILVALDSRLKGSLGPVSHTMLLLLLLLAVPLRRTAFSFV
jgi:hypothetical protein